MGHLDSVLWMRSKGVQVGDTVSGVLTGWLATSAGDWYGLVSYEATVDHKPMRFEAQWVPAGAIRLDDTGG